MHFFSRVKFVDKLFFTKHLAIMIKSGITLIEALDVLRHQAKSATFKAVLDSLYTDVQNGQSFAKSLQRHANVFDDLYISLIEIGEESGSLEDNLGFLAKQMSKSYALQKKVQSAMFYPIIVFSATMIIGGFIAFFILPQLVDFFGAFDVELPLPTKILLFFANMVKNYGIVLLPFIIGAGILPVFLVRIPSIRYLWDKVLLKFPLFGEIVSDSQLARFSRNLGTMLQSGVTVLNSLETVAKGMSNKIYQEGVFFAKEEVRKGKPLATSLEQFSFAIFPPIVTRMLAVGEKSGHLEETLLYLGDFYEEEIDNITKNLTTILEPVLLLFIGLVVGFVALAIISPIYELTGSIKK